MFQVPVVGEHEEVVTQEGLVDVLEACDDEDAALSAFVNDFFDQPKGGDDRNAYNK